jgi:hypothetical protein
MPQPFAPGIKNKANDCDGWRDKLVGKVVLEDHEESTLGADEVRSKIIVYATFSFLISNHKCIGYS